MKRCLDLLVSGVLLTLTSPVVAAVLFLVWAQDRHSPLYIANRVGRNGRPFRMVKIRSMIIGADTSGVDSTASNDRRITPIGAFVRRFKIDELAQLWNVLRGDMSLVGPRPNVERDVALYTEVEAALLSVRPGITDFASVVFADEGAILEGYPDPDLSYNQLIRPWKSRLGLLYVRHQSLLLDLQLVWLTAVAIVAREKALQGVHRLLTACTDDITLLRVVERKDALQPYPPPGAREVVNAR